MFLNYIFKIMKMLEDLHLHLMPRSSYILVSLVGVFIMGIWVSGQPSVFHTWKTAPSKNEFRLLLTLAANDFQLE